MITAATPSLIDYPRAAVAPTGVRTVSVVTVVRNGVTTLSRAAESVFAQDFPDLEYVIVDGASTDGTVELIRGFGPRVATWVSEPDRGISDAFNKGIALSSGEIVGLLNCDDWYSPGTIAAAVCALRESGADVVHGPLQYWEDGRKSYRVAGDAGLLETGMTVAHPTVFVRRAVYERCGLFRLDFARAMDYEWLLRARVGGARFVYAEGCVVNMRLGGASDRDWWRGLIEVERARCLHLPALASPAHSRLRLAWAIVRTALRRMFDAAGMSTVRHWYHRAISRLKITRPE